MRKMGPSPHIGNVYDGIDIERIKKYYVEHFRNEAVNYCKIVGQLTCAIFVIQNALMKMMLTLVKGIDDVNLIAYLKKIS